MKRMMLTASMIGGLVLAGCSGPQERPPKQIEVSEDDAFEAEVYAEARSQLEPLAERGDATSQKNLGVMYYLGQGVDVDYAAAFDWFSKAAAQDEDVAQLFLGVMYAEGQGVPQDHVRAHMWLTLSAQQGNSSAIFRLEGLAEKMTPEQVAEGQQLAEVWQPG